MTKYKRIAINTSKSVFAIHCRRSESAGFADQSSPRANAPVLQQVCRHRSFSRRSKPSADEFIDISRGVGI
jgi:hypothetical protein